MRVVEAQRYISTQRERQRRLREVFPPVERYPPCASHPSKTSLLVQRSQQARGALQAPWKARSRIPNEVGYERVTGRETSAPVTRCSCRLQFFVRWSHMPLHVVAYPEAAEGT